MLVGIKTENARPSMQPAGSTSCAKPTTPKPAHNEGRWTDTEHGLFLDGLRRYGRQWFNVGKVVKTRSVTQIRTHAQKYFAKQEKEVNSMLQTITTKAKTPRKRADASEAPVVSPLAKRHGPLHHTMAHKMGCTLCCWRLKRHRRMTLSTDATSSRAS
ncbi:hypothetical protein SPRG_19507 [Saprolegnia parasitica CBS 223.65]|uniref:Uncharacterized protein n=1 Tax=Saprolegnia parasitica (strain CBS 223.65) TaxID=695850 RepID=A0A067CLM4_SAPPC|nr:hypothetical protein SPRG_19507 [Saprolegnia parasitica CBS 223.65]KDO31604.1 hypothetical protein SPRG_19507 [Saprolegnia parasitica CBS 223.65]|eukprot:XP_012197761.1 hypothetical protein SPRG_19507 [Saprolegnia parasitica CBS 223.65]